MEDTAVRDGRGESGCRRSFVEARHRRKMNEWGGSMRRGEEGRNKRRGGARWTDRERRGRKRGRGEEKEDDKCKRGKTSPRGEDERAGKMSERRKEEQ
jgi:hypothetical protein